jgi:hypothetical protein
MKHNLYGVGLLLGTLLVTPASSQAPKGPVSNLEPVYNLSTVVSISGNVTEVRDVPAGNPLPGWHVTLKSNSDTFDVYLAPASFMKVLKAAYASGDRIKLSGSRVKFNNADVILTREVTKTKNAEAILLREGDGSPVWEDWGVPMP